MTITARRDNVSGASLGPPSPGAVRVTLAVLTLFYVLSFVDRQILSILAEPIRKELGLSDTQIGLMTGLAFAMLYTVGGIPLARLADRPRTDRITLMTVCLGLWSAVTALCGVAQSFTQLVMLRIGVGIGEAGCTPAAHSLISDLVPDNKRASAMAIYGLGQPIGALLGLIIGGLIAGSHGWRAAFVVVGLPGLILAIVTRIMLRDPRRSGGVARPLAAAAPTPTVQRESLRGALGTVFASRAFSMMLVAGSIIAFLSYGLNVWTTIFFLRSFNLSTGQVGLWYGLVAGGSGIVGTLLGGYLSDRFGARGARFKLVPTVVALLIATPAQLLAFSCADWHLALAMLVVPGICLGMSYGPAWGLTQSLMPQRVRATAAAVKLFAQALLGIGFGPLLFGIASDALKPMAGTESVRWVLLGATLLLLVPAAAYWRAGRLVDDELRALAAHEAERT